MAAVVLTIAGSDPSGGAGIQADLKTFAALGVYGAAVITSLTAQNTVGVRGRHDVPAAFVGAQLDAVFDDLAVDAAKIGLVPDAGVAEVVAARLRVRPPRALVVDPVMVATSGARLTAPSSLEALRGSLLPLASLVTPNLAEAEALAGRPVRTVRDMREAGIALLAQGARAVLVKGGHLPERACDVLVTETGAHELDAPRLDVGPIHGTGCTLSAAIAVELALGRSLLDAVRSAKAYVRQALAEPVAVGHGSRVLDHRIRR